MDLAAIEASSDATSRRLFDVDPVGAFDGLRETLPSMRHAGGGVVVSMLSIAGLTGDSGIDGYVAATWGVRGLTEAVALEFAPARIRVRPQHAVPPIERVRAPAEVARMV